MFKKYFNNFMMAHWEENGLKIYIVLNGTRCKYRIFDLYHGIKIDGTAHTMKEIKQEIKDYYENTRRPTEYRGLAKTA